MMEKNSKYAAFMEMGIKHDLLSSFDDNPDDLPVALIEVYFLFISLYIIHPVLRLD